MKGMKDLQNADVQKYGPGDYIPHVTSMYWTFRAMIFSGSLVLLVAIMLRYELIVRQIGTITRYVTTRILDVTIPLHC